MSWVCRDCGFCSAECWKTCPRCRRSSQAPSEYKIIINGMEVLGTVSIGPDKVEIAAPVATFMLFINSVKMVGPVEIGEDLQNAVTAADRHVEHVTRGLLENVIAAAESEMAKALPLATGIGANAAVTGFAGRLVDLKNAAAAAAAEPPATGGDPPVAEGIVSSSRETWRDRPPLL